jgi:hypothetical protein
MREPYECVVGWFVGWVGGLSVGLLVDWLGVLVAGSRDGRL